MSKHWKLTKARRVVAPGVQKRQYEHDEGYVLSITMLDNKVVQASIKAKDPLEKITFPSVVFVNCEEEPIATIEFPARDVREDEIDEFIRALESEKDLIISAKELIVKANE